MFPSHSSTWVAADIEQVFATNYKEGRHIDYKQALTTNPIELATDVSAFANTDGGVIVYGISDDDGYPKECVGLNVEGRDKEELRIEAVLQTNLDPPMRGCKFDWITTGDGKTILALRVPQSASAPHMITKNSRNFYSRGESGNAPLGWFELKNAFSSHGLSARFFTEFVTERCDELANKNGTFPMIPGGYAVLHLMPVSAITRPLDIPVPELREVMKEVSPPSTSGSWGTRPCLKTSKLLSRSSNPRGKRIGPRPKS